MLLYHYCTNTVVQGIIAIITIYILVPSENCELKQILLPPPSKIYVFFGKIWKFCYTVPYICQEYIDHGFANTYNI